MRLQCGYCTPGFLMLAAAYLEKNSKPDEEEIRELVASNLCRCTGYQNIVRAICVAAERAPMTMIGKSVQRLEDEPLITGRGKFIANLSFPGELHMRVVRSPYAHATLNKVDAEAALALRRRCRGLDVRRRFASPPIEFRPTKVQGLEPYRQTILAKDRLRYVGEPVAVVFADSSYVAEDAADLVAIDATQLARRASTRAVPTSNRPCCARSTATSMTRSHTAHQTLTLDLAIGRHSGVPLECRGAIARHDAGSGILELYGATKRPHANRDVIARMLQRDPTSIHLFEGHVGGGFGVRGELYPEDLLVCLAAIKLGRPIKWIEDRRENLIACNQSREQSHHVTVAIDAKGHILGLQDEFFHDQGAYVRTHGARVPDMTAGMLPSVYRIPAYRAIAHFRLTNKTPAATYRAPGRFESTFVIERVLDAIAARLKIDRAEVRRRNLIRKDEMPFARPIQVLETDLVLDSGDYAMLLQKAQDAFGWNALQTELEQRRAAGESVGMGLALFLEKSGLGPTDLASTTLLETGEVEARDGRSLPWPGRGDCSRSDLRATRWAWITARFGSCTVRPTGFARALDHMPHAPR